VIRTAAAIHTQAIIVLEAALRPGKMANDRANLSEDYSSRDGGYFRSNGSQHGMSSTCVYHARVSAGTMAAATNHRDWCQYLMDN